MWRKYAYKGERWKSYKSHSKYPGFLFVCCWMMMCTIIINWNVKSLYENNIILCSCVCTQISWTIIIQIRIYYLQLIEDYDIMNMHMVQTVYYQINCCLEVLH